MALPCPPLPTPMVKPVALTHDKKSCLHIGGFDDEERNLAELGTMKSSENHFFNPILKPAFFEVFKPEAH